MIRITKSSAKLPNPAQWQIAAAFIINNLMLVCPQTADSARAAAGGNYPGNPAVTLLTKYQAIRFKISMVIHSSENTAKYGIVYL